MKLKHSILYNLINLRGWRTNRKIVVIESDDWGSIRMPSKEVYDTCLKAGYPVHLNPYERYDSLASQDDLERLFGLLSHYKDFKGNHPVITANCVVANPDFDAIKASNYEHYHFELITETFKRYPKHANNLELWKDGLLNRVFYPQYHAREHVNVSLFMKALHKNDENIHFAFDNRMPGIIDKGNSRNGNNYVEATAYSSENDKNEKLDIYLEGMDIFEKLFGYSSESIIPTNYKWSNDYNQAVAEKGVKYIQGTRRMIEPVPGSKSKVHKRYLGKQNSYGQIDLVRNVVFEPSLVDTSDIVNDCLHQMDIAFRMQKPAVISCHRINFVGFIDNKNSEGNLSLLNELLKKALSKWPEIEFLNSVELGGNIEKKGCC